MDDRVASTTVPLVVDLDGTLLKVDTLHEAFIQLSSQLPLQALNAVLALRRGPAAFKAAVADHALPDVATAPIDLDVLEAVQQARREGRQTYLATAADRRYAEAIAATTGAFDGVFATENGINLKGQAKADRLVAAFGPRGFDYVGNSDADMPIWRVARSPIVASAPERLVKRLSRERPDAVVLSARKVGLWPYLSALRPHQWLKNGLVVLPAIAGHDFTIDTLTIVLIAFASFSLCASSAYLVNDMLDLPHDRVHDQKRRRPLAAGTIPISHAVVLLCILVMLSVVLALMLPWAFLLVLAGYTSLTMAYAFYLKRKLMVDVVALAALYGLRVLAGAAATGIMLSHWLVGFCFFIFLSLALIKRTTEMIALPESRETKIKGRGYRRGDLPVIIALTAAAGFVAVLVLALYIASPDVKPLYSRPELLWGICVILVYWLGRVCFLTGRREMNQDPVMFAATDRISWMAGASMAAVFVAAL